MWCAHCQADVAAEVAADNRRIRCASCGSQIDSARGRSVADKTREARELLERWSSQRVLEPAGELRTGEGAGRPTGAFSSSSPEALLEEISRPAHPTLKPKFVARLDRPHLEAFSSAPDRSDDAVRPGTATNSARMAVPLKEIAAAARIEPYHEAQVPAPHFSVQPPVPEPERRPGHWASGFGQLLAYGGVLGLTVGTTLVVWGYFGGAAHQSYAPTGWLVATLGQMLLFLGVITIVSGGMEQTTAEVSRQVRTLGDRLLRIEQASRDHALRGPSIPAERFAELPSARDGEARYAATNAK